MSQKARRGKRSWLHTGVGTTRTIEQSYEFKEKAMAHTIHAPHLPHLEDWARHRTLMIGIAAVAITAGTVYVVQQQTNDSTPAATSSAPAATGSLELRAGPSRAGSKAFGSAPAAATASVELRSGHLLPGTGMVEGATVAASAPAAVDSSAFRSGHLLPGTDSSERAPLTSSVPRVSVHGR